MDDFVLSLTNEVTRGAGTDVYNGVTRVTINLNSNTRMYLVPFDKKRVFVFAAQQWCPRRKRLKRKKSSLLDSNTVGPSLFEAVYLCFVGLT